MVYLCEMLIVIIFIVINLIGIGLTTWGGVYLSNPPSPLEPCTLIWVSCNSSSAYVMKNLGSPQIGKMQFVYFNDTETVNANYTVFVDNICLSQQPTPDTNHAPCAYCALGINYHTTIGSTYYCDINNNKVNVINNWYYNPCGPNVVYAAPLVIGIVILLILWLIYIKMCCDGCCDDFCDDN
jgi:hypothetical protein